jgi:hypothetical protein
MNNKELKNKIRQIIYDAQHDHEINKYYPSAELRTTEMLELFQSYINDNIKVLSVFKSDD